jgi:hypothetical protein
MSPAGAITEQESCKLVAQRGHRQSLANHDGRDGDGLNAPDAGTARPFGDRAQGSCQWLHGGRRWLQGRGAVPPAGQLWPAKEVGMATRDRMLCSASRRGIELSLVRRRCLWLCLALSLAGGCRHEPRDPPAPRREDSEPAAILRAAWDRVPLVALGEAHAIKEHGAFLVSLIDGGAIANQLDDIVVEFGSADHQGIVDRYVAGEPVSASDMDRVLRDTTQLVVWDSPIYANIFSAVRRANQRRPASRPVRVVLGDPPIDWAGTQTAEDYRKIADERDRHFAAVVEREVLAKGRKALLLFGAFHALKRGPSLDTVGALLEQRRAGSVFVVMLYHGMGPHSARVEAALSRGPRPGIILLSRSWIGSLPARSAFVLPPALQLPAELKLRDIADAYLYLGPADSLTRAWPPSTVYEAEPEYLRELERRYPIVFGVPLDKQQLLDREP